MAILIIFLRNWHAALIVACVIPLSLAAAFILMNAKGVSANLISLGAVDFGIIIDSAVVLVEALMVKLAAEAVDTYGKRQHILHETVDELGRPILFSKAIIILAFMPIFTFQRVEGKIFSPMAFTLSFALLGAILLTLTLVPVLLSLTMRKNTLAEKHSTWVTRLQEWYRDALVWAQSHRGPVITTSVAAVVVAVLLAPQLGSEFLPKLDEGNIWLTITLPPSTNLEKSREVESHVRAVLRSFPEVNNVAAQVGRPDDGTDPKGPNNIEVMADLKPRSTWRYSDKAALIEAIGNKIHEMPGIPTNFSQVIQDNVEEALSGVKGEISVKVFGPNLDILQAKANQIAEILRSIRGASDVGAIQIGGQTELLITLNRAAMGRYGLSVIDVNNTIQTTLAGSQVGSFYEGERRFDITLRFDKNFRSSVDEVADLPVALPDHAGTIPLRQIATIEVKQGAGMISRESGGRIASVKANLLGRDQGSFVQEAMRKVSEQVILGPGYYITWGGQFENQQRAMRRLQVIIPLSLLSIFVLLFWVFRSVKKALLVLLMIPFTLIGGLAGLALAQLHLSISAAVGFIAVAGISVQNGVIMVEQFLKNTSCGLNQAESILEGATQRLRPILMTALMAGLGLLPAALSHGIGSETQKPFAVVIVGGIVSSTIFTLLLLPLAYPLFSKELEEDSSEP